jgi:ABC-2 type transport system permease protein
MNKCLSHPTLKSHLRALWAIARKDWITYWRYPLSAVSSVLQPIVWLTPVYFMGLAFSVNGKALGFAAYSGTTDYMSFILLGTVLSNFISAVFWGMGFSLKNDMDAGVLESNWLAPLPRPLLLVGRTYTSLVINTITSLMMLLVAGLIFGFQISGNVLPAILTALPMLIGLYGFGFAFAAVVLLMREANTMVDISSYLVQLFSGANFPVNALPRWLLPVALILPGSGGLAPWVSTSTYPPRNEDRQPTVGEIPQLPVFVPAPYPISYSCAKIAPNMILTSSRWFVAYHHHAWNPSPFRANLD